MDDHTDELAALTLLAAPLLWLGLILALFRHMGNRRVFGLQTRKTGS